MDGKILEFAILLRKAGINVSHSEVADCLQALKMIELEKESFYNTLACSMIKDYSDLHIFDKIFYYFFHPDFFAHKKEFYTDTEFSVQHGSDEEGGECSGSCTGSDTISSSDSDRSTGFGQGQGLATSAVDTFVQIIKLGDPQEMDRMIKKGIESLGKIREDDLKDMKETIRQVKVFLEWNMSVNRLEKESVNEEETVKIEWQERLQDLEELLLRELERKTINELGTNALETILVRENLKDLDFYRLSSHQAAEMKRKISKIGHRLASRLSFRQKRAKRGNIDLRRTIRKSMNTGGVPVRPAYRNRFPSRPQLVVLCDLSGSVKVFSEFMLQLVYSIQTRFIHVRSFVFVDTPDEITEYFRNNEIEEAIRDIYNKAKFAKVPFSHYGETFLDFCNKYSDVLDKKATLVIIGDARNNYHTDHADYFQQMSSLVKRVIWLNPEPREKWDKEDSIMSVYGRFCSDVYECRNLVQLDRLARKLI